MRVDYHVHTCHSFDCNTPLEVVAASAIAAGLDRICVTDHDTLEGARRLLDMGLQGLDIVVGCELAADDGSQVIGLGLQEAIPTRSVLGLMDAIKAQGGQVLIPHPFRHGSGVFRSEARRPADFVEMVLEIADFVECFNGSDIYQANRTSYRFVVDHGLAAVAGSDAHSADAIGSVYVEFADDRAANEAAESTTPRTVWFPNQSRTPDLTPVKRAFHRLPVPVQDIARRLRQGAGLEPVPATAGDARRQLILPLSPGNERRA